MAGIKKVIKGIIKKLVVLILPIKNIGFFESVPDLSDNTKPVFDEMIKRGMNENYKFVWLVKTKSSDLPKIKNVSYLARDDRFFAKKELYYHYYSRFKVCCNAFLCTARNGQTSFYITHGTGIKSVRNYYNVPSEIDYILVDGEGTREMTAWQLNGDINKHVALGYPRNDVLVSSKYKSIDLFPENKGEKIVVWYPTFRQHKSGHLFATAKALPILHDEKQAEKLNEIAKENKVLLVLKPHFAQDVSKIKACELSNIKFIDDEFFVKNNVTSYEFIAGCDALLSDYSSVYYDYLLCDKPIGLVWEDYEEYKKTTNFVLDMDYYMKAGEKIYNIEDFEKFLKNLATGNDTLKAERAEISAWANYARDGKSAERVTDFIIEKAGL